MLIILFIAAIPLSPSHPNEQIEYFINDSSASVIIATAEFESKLKPLAEKLNKPFLVIENVVQSTNDENGVDEIKNFLVNEIPCRSNDPAMIM